MASPRRSRCVRVDKPDVVWFGSTLCMQSQSSTTAFCAPNQFCASEVDVHTWRCSVPRRAARTQLQELVLVVHAAGGGHPCLCCFIGDIRELTGAFMPSGPLVERQFAARCNAAREQTCLGHSALQRARKEPLRHKLVGCYAERPSTSCFVGHHQLMLGSCCAHSVSRHNACPCREQKLVVPRERVAQNGSSCAAVRASRTRKLAQIVSIVRLARLQFSAH